MALTQSRKTVKPLDATTRLMLTFRHLEIDGHKSWRNLWCFAQHAADNGSDVCAKVMDFYKRLTRKEQRAATPEFICQEAGIDSDEFSGEVFASYMKYSNGAANVIAAAALPKVVKRSVAQALTPEGYRDRQMQFQHSGFLPTKQGSNINVSANANVDSRTAVVTAAELPSMESDSLRFTKILRNNAAELIDQPKGVAAVKSFSGQRSSDVDDNQ